MPTLIHPVNVVIEQKDEAGTKFRADAREPVRKMKRNNSVTLSGQIKWKKTADPRATLEGPAEDYDGYILFRFKDLTAAGVTLKRGDKVAKIDKVDMESFLTQLRPAGHYPDQGGATLLKAFFSDREPT